MKKKKRNHEISKILFDSEMIKIKHHTHLWRIDDFRKFRKYIICKSKFLERKEKKSMSMSRKRVEVGYVGRKRINE